MRKLIIAAILLAYPLGSLAIDPVLAGTVAIEIGLAEKQFDDRKKLQQSIRGTELAISAGLQMLHQTEEKIIDYMSNASSAVENLYQMKEIALLTADIGKQSKNILDAIKENPKGAVLASVGSKKIAEASEHIVQVNMTLMSLVKTGKFSNDRKSKVNMLSAAERAEILNKLTYELSSVKWKLWLFAAQVRYWGFGDLWRALDYSSWAKMVGMEANARYVVMRWNQTFKKNY